MSESAIDRRAERRRATVAVLVALARRRTAEDGLTGYTVEDLCTEVGISRRSFFNYFASKEDAVLGIDVRADHSRADEAFLAGGDPESSGVSATLLEDLAQLVLARWESLDISPRSVQALIAAVEREPRLLRRAFEHGTASQASMAALVSRREGLPPDDLRAAVAVQVVDALSRSATDEFLSPGSAEPFPTIFARRIRAARDLFLTQTRT